VQLIEAPPGIVTPLPTPLIRQDVADWLDANTTRGWQVVHEGPPWADHAIAFDDL
jgi:hypothetical protein